VENTEIRSFRDLKVWQGAMALVQETCANTAHFAAKETYGLTQQIQRAVVSVPSNIAEGHSRDSSKEYLHHISIAIGSLAELETQLELAGRLQYLDSGKLSKALHDITAVRMMLRALQRAMKTRVSTRVG
jgi:four helix bundle protein